MVRHSYYSPIELGILLDGIRDKKSLADMVLLLPDRKPRGIVRKIERIYKFYERQFRKTEEYKKKQRQKTKRYNERAWGRNKGKYGEIIRPLREAIETNYEFKKYAAQDLEVRFTTLSHVLNGNRKPTKHFLNKCLDKGLVSKEYYMQFSEFFGYKK